MKSANHLAVIVEPESAFAEALRESLEDYGFDVVTAPTHTDAARSLGGRHPYLLIACTPASPDDLPDAYLGDYQRASGLIPTLLMVADSAEQAAPIARTAARLLKPFNRGELLLAVDGILHTSKRQIRLAP